MGIIMTIQNPKMTNPRNAIKYSSRHSTSELPISSISSSPIFHHPARFLLTIDAPTGPAFPHAVGFRLLEHEATTNAQAPQHIHTILANAQTAWPHGKTTWSACGDAVTDGDVRGRHGERLGGKWQRLVHLKANEAFHLSHERAEVMGLLAADVGQALQENAEVLLAFVVGW